MYKSIAIYSSYQFHYANMPMLDAAIFEGYKNDNFQPKNCNSFLNFALKHRLWVLVRTS